MSVKEAGIWELLEEYADIRDELEDALSSFEVLAEDINLAMEEIREELETLQEHFRQCSHSLIRYRGPSKPGQLPFNLSCE